MKLNTIKAKLSAGENILGMTMNFTSTTIVELAALIGFDYVLFDAEHGPLGLSDIEQMVITAEARSITPIARVPNLSPDVALRFLDTGLQGLMYPGLNTVEDARTAVKNTKYPPKGERGLGIVRANDWGSIGAPEFVETSNNETLVLGLIEGTEGVANLNQIVEVDGLDVLWIGPTDLSQSMGLAGNTDHREVQKVVEQIIGTVRAAGKTAGIGVGDASAIPNYRDMGATCFSVQARQLLVGSGKSFLKQAREVLSEQNPEA